jgi:type IV pilus assembly protein PilC
MTQFSFQYKAIDRNGSQTRGVMKADTRDDAYRQIVNAGLRPVKIVSKRSSRGRSRKITLKDLSHFTYQFAVLMEARIPIVDGLRSIVDQEPNERLRDVVLDIARQIESGSSVTEAMGPHRELFGEVYVETIRAAEISGNMIEVLGRLAKMLDSQYEIQRNVKGALMYPVCVVAALTLAVTFLMIFVVPKFAEMFASRGIALPLPTQFVIGVSDVLRDYWYAHIVGVIGGIWLLRRAWRNPRARARIDNLLHHVPYMRTVLKGLAISRFAGVLGISLRSGLSLIDAIEMGGRASGRPLLALEAEKLRDQVNTGGRLSDVIVTCQYLPTFTRRMIAAGEEAGELPSMCEIVARNYDREVEHLAKNVTTVIEPIMIMGLAGVVLLIALAIFLPMWNMTSIVG